MNRILSTTMLSLPKEIQNALMEESVLFYYPDQEENIMRDEERRKLKRRFRKWSG